MGSSSGNRYDLLFMDDDFSDPLNEVVEKSETAMGKLNVMQNIKQIGKENKSSAMNKTAKKIIGGKGVSAATEKGTVLAAPSGQLKDKPKRTFISKEVVDDSEETLNINFRQQYAQIREQRNNRRNRDELPPPQQTGADTPDEFEQNPDRPSRRGSHRRYFEGGRGGNREFDRQSGSNKTGVKAIDKRDGAGAHNWGSLQQDIEDLDNSNEELVAIDNDDSIVEQQSETQAITFQEEVKELLTLDEWKAQRAIRAAPKYNIRQPGEGEDLLQWEKMIALVKKKRDEENDEELEYDPSMYPQRVGRLQHVPDIEFRFNDGRGRGRVRRGRGRGQPPVSRIKEAGGDGEQPHGGGGGSDGQHEPPKVDDEYDFPYLG